MTGPSSNPICARCACLHRGKVRDLYEIDAERLLIVQTDRLSAFDVILPTPVPGKGEVLTALSLFWFRRLAHVVPNHLLAVDPASLVCSRGARPDRRARYGRAQAQAAAHRGHRARLLAGSGWKEYQRTGAICGIALPAGLREAERLPGADIHAVHQSARGNPRREHRLLEAAERLLGARARAQVRDKAIALYSEAADYARTRGIIIADTKFEFGTDPPGTLYLIDEALTPDSSRFWPVDQYRPGSSPPSFDKQYVRDWLESQHWDKKPPAPALPPEVLARTAEKYREALRLLTGS